MLKAKEKLVPQVFIEFEDGTEVEYHNLMSELQDMYRSEKTWFNLNREYDKAVFDFITNRTDFTKEVGYVMSDKPEFPVIIWNNNWEFIVAIEDEIYQIRGQIIEQTENK
jgi:hypothetical protein